MTPPFSVSAARPCCVPKLRLLLSCAIFVNLLESVGAQDADTVICGGFVKSEYPLDFTKIEVQLLDKSGNLKYQAACAANNGNYEVPIFGKKGDFSLVISGPQGLVFEPSRIDVRIDGTTDPCSKQQNLDFRFAGYSITGKVQSKGNQAGPPGVTVKISDSSNKPVATAITDADGQFRVPSLLPGVFHLEASHPHFKFHQAKATVTVTENTLNVPDQSLVVAGYPVSGSVESSGEPVGGVQFLLYSTTVQSADISGCDKPSQEKDKTSQQKHGRLLCSVKSDQKGNFAFQSLVPATYTLIPVYSGGNTKYDIEPSTFHFTLGHDAMAIAKAFEIKGFTAAGTVLTSVKGSGVPSAEIYINGTLATKTDKNGKFQLDKTVPGYYKIEVKKEHYDFPTVYTKITPTESTVAPIIARSMSVCGEVRTLRPISRLLSFEAVDTKTGLSRDTVIRDSHFCILLETGEYRVSIFDAPNDKAQRLVFSPADKVIQLKDFPVTDLLFTQVLGSVSGTVKCLGPCPKDLRVAMLTEIGEVFADLDAGSGFKFNGVDLGVHTVKVVEPSKRLCWDLVQKTIELTVKKPTVVVSFTQTGFLFEIWTSHETEFAYWSVTGDSKKQTTTTIKTGFAEICLPQPGQYHIQPKSCHKFEQDVYVYDTSAPERLSIHAVSHLTNISVKTDDDKMPFKLRIKKTSDGSSSILTPSGQHQILGPDLYQHSFLEYFAVDEELTIVPSSDTLLFKPAQAELLVTDNCEKNIVTLEAFKGVLITGQTVPAVAEADVVMITEAEVLRGKTDSSGKYSLGPIPRSAFRDVSVERRGYLFEKINDSLNFKASKLSEIRVLITDKSQTPLSGVLVSISSAAGVRISNFTDQAGSLSFVSFAPGEYIVRPMVKEYKFDPSSKSVTVSQGQTASVDWVGTRVAYSVFGRVGALGGEPEAGVVFEAVSIEPCPQMQEESVSGANGQFRISGLKAGCSYEVRAKEGELARLDLKWTSPANRTVHMGTEDVSGMTFMAFRGFNEAEFTGRIATTKDLLGQLKVCLYRADRPDESIQCISFTVNPMFYFNPVHLDGRAYILRIDSSLSKKEFVFSTDELNVIANSTFRHFVMLFTASRRQLEPEIDISTMWIVPFAVIAAVLYFKRDTLLPALQALLERVVSGKGFTSSLKDKRKATPSSAAVSNQGDDFDDFSTSSTLKKRTKPK